MRFRIGNQTSFSAAAVTEPFEFALANEFDAFEWFPDRRESGQGWAEDDLSKETRAWISGEAKNRDMSLSVHAPWSANPLRDPSGEELRRARELAVDIGAVLLNIHMSPDAGIEVFGDALAPLARILSDEGIRLSVENTVHTGPEDFNGLFTYLRTRYPRVLLNLGMCFDVGHANLYGSTRNDYLGYLDRLDPDVPIVHVHLHENYGDADSHLPLFTGPSSEDDAGIRGLLKRLARRRYSGALILEQWPQPPALLLHARQRLLGLMDDEPVTPEGHGGGPGGDLVTRMAEASRRHLSWRNRLDWVRQVLTDPSCPADGDLLAHLAVYLRFLGTGALPCAEDGGHYRPSHHARMSEQIYQALLGIEGPGTSLLVRKIIPWLPSFDSAFTRHEPLTRIRDIAHRNDIPKELKSEIKHRLQNKLHRSAGPEDLATSAALLERVTRPGAGYPASFVEEFRLFHEELKEFFNARTLDERLEKLLPRTGAAVADSIHRFLAAKKGESGAFGPLTELALLTEVRVGVAEILGTFHGRGTAERLEWHLADLALEEYLFVVLSRLVNSLESASGDLSLSPSASPPLPSAPPLEGEDKTHPQVAVAEHLLQSVLTSTRLAVVNLRLSGVEDEECHAIESELAAWGRTFNSARREDVLRLKATLARCRRLSERYADLILSLLSKSVESLGEALGVSAQARKFYTESDIRSHSVFQVSRLVSFAERSICSQKAGPRWDVIVPGAALGRVVSSGDLSGAFSQALSPVIALLRGVSGDEEIPPAVKGLIVGHETPRLSHLAIRARQAGVVFAACRDAGHFSQVEKLQGRYVSVRAAADDVRIESASSEGDRSTGAPLSPALAVPRTALYEGDCLLDLSAATPETCGAKAFSLKRLSELPGRAGAGISTLPAFVVPFGVMEEALRQSPGLHRQYRALLARVNSDEAQVSPETCTALRSLVSGVAVPEEVLRRVAGRFGADAGLVVRSSANTEDMNGFSSAGLHESFVNVKPSSVGAAVSRVWSSLWTGRAAASRISARISHGDVRMAVIIQQMAAPDYAFVVNTRNPFSDNPDQVYIEIVAGLGETLASARVAGTPCRLLYDRKSGKVVTLDLASFSKAAVPDAAGGLSEATLDYSKVALTADDAFRRGLAGRVGHAAVFLEKAFEKPQDIEGVVSGNDLYVVQSRPQHVQTRASSHGH